MTKLSDLVYEEQLGKTGYPLDRIRHLFNRSLTMYEKEGSPFKFGMGENYYWLTTGLSYSGLNGAGVYSSDPQILEEALAPLYEARIPHSIALGGAGLVHADALRAKGYVNKGAAPLMGYALDPEKDFLNLRPGLEVKRVEVQGDLDQAVSVLSESFKMSVEDCLAYCSASLGVGDAFRYILLDDGQPVATALFARVEKFLTCWDVATVPAHQRKGYGEELLRWAMATHAAQGAQLVVLAASTPGQPLYRRLGFQFLEFMQSWHLEDLDRMRRFTHEILTLGEFTLRQVQANDEELLVPCYSDQVISKWIPIPYPYSSEDFQEHLKRADKWRTAGFGIDWVIERDGIPVGNIGCHHTDWKQKRTEIGYMAFASSRGTGVIPTVLRQLVEFLFVEYGFERIEVRTDVRNESSRRAAQKAGFTLEGVLRRNYLKGEELCDDAVFALISDDLNKGGSTQ